MEQMEYIEIPLRGKHGKGKFVLVDGDYDGEYFSQFTWYLLPNGYAGRDGRYDGEKGYIYLHNMVMPRKKGFWVDHIDRNKLNNRSYNLRYVTSSESAINRPQVVSSRGNKTGFRGVRFMNDGRASPYRLVFRGKYIGQYTNAEQAGKHYDRLAKAYYGDEAILNFTY